MNLKKVFLFGIKDKLNMKKIDVSFAKCSCKCIVIKIFKIFYERFHTFIFHILYFG